jgi:fatty-acyl-CoA synthase
MIRGNVVMKGYLGNESTTEEVFRGGWFHTGDLAVSHPNGRFELKDRSKDIIISGGENISSIEVENTLISHPAVGEVAVVAMPHEFWGEVPCAFVTRRPGVPAAVAAALTEQELILYARTHMPHYAAPKAVRFVESLPKTSTGKVQKHELRKLLATSQQQKQQ